jgi:hypothetical protein
MDCRPLSDRRENPMRRLLTFITLTVALPLASCPVFAGDSSLSGNPAPASGITGATKTQHKHHAKSAKTTADDNAKTEAAAGGTAGAVIKAPKTDPAVNRLNTVLPP